MKKTKKILSILMAVIMLLSSLFTASGAEETTEETETKTIEQLTEVVHFGGHSYQVIKTNMNWDEAKALCEDLGGHLITINSEEENKWITGILKEYAKIVNYIWLGGYKDKEEKSNKKWKWITGEPFDYTNWKTGEPNDYYNGRENYLSMYIWENLSYTGCWNDTTLDNENLNRVALVCEWESDSEIKFPNITVFPGMKTEYNGHTYGIYTDKLSWNEAVEFCKSQGGHLATITSDEENNVITSMLAGENLAYWIGAEYINGDWTWITDENWGYTNWGSGEPSFMDEEHLCARINCETSGVIESIYGYDFNQGDWDSCRNFDASKHSIPVGGFICEWDKDSKLDYYATFGDSKEYIPELSCIAVDLSEAAYGAADYDPAVLISAYEEHGFDVGNSDYFGVYDYEEKYNPYRSGCAIGFKKSAYSDDMICLVAVRGSLGSKATGSDWHGNYTILTNGEGKHIGFANPALQIYKYINEMIDNLNFTGNIKYVITGHSRGAGVANLLSVELMEKGVSADNVFNYNFACPDVACKYIFTNYNNVFNICNRLDIVPHIPGKIASALTSPGTSWGKFGITYWFTRDAEDKHAISLHREFVYDNPDLPNLDKSEGDVDFDNDMLLLGWLTKVFCPVDVIVTDTDGNRVASVINGETNYYDSNYDEVIILTDGDKKVVYIAGDRDFNVELIGTDTGEVIYSVEKYNPVTGEVLESKTFSAVELFDGKTMNSPVSQAATTNDIELYVVQNVDGEDVISHSINTDGTEVEISHIYNLEKTIPTCTKKGYTTYTCTGCGYSYTDNYTEATGHLDNNNDNLCDSCGEQMKQNVDVSCNHICHTDNEFLKFIWEIYNFLMKIFSMERICTCGAAHY